jgi:hypothetical protein
VSVYADPAIRGKGARARLKDLKRGRAIARQEANIKRGTDRRTGEPYAFAPIAKFQPKPRAEPS